MMVGAAFILGLAVGFIIYMQLFAAADRSFKKSLQEIRDDYQDELNRMKAFYKERYGK